MYYILNVLPWLQVLSLFTLPVIAFISPIILILTSDLFPVLWFYQTCLCSDTFSDPTTYVCNSCKGSCFLVLFSLFQLMPTPLVCPLLFHLTILHSTFQMATLYFVLIGQVACIVNIVFVAFFVYRCFWYTYNFFLIGSLAVSPFPAFFCVLHYAFRVISLL